MFSKFFYKIPFRKDQHSFRSVYYFSRCVGLWPFTITYNSNGSIKGARVHLLDGLWLLVSMCLYWIALFYTVDDMINAQGSDEIIRFSDMIFHLSQIVVVLFGPVCIVLDLFNRNSLIHILEKFIIFDNQVRIFRRVTHTMLPYYMRYYLQNTLGSFQMSKFGILFDYKSENRHAFLFLMIPMLITFPVEMLTIIEFNPDWKTSARFLRWSVPHLLRSWFCISISVSFAIFIRCLYIRFAGINTLLRSHYQLISNIHKHTKQLI